MTDLNKLITDKVSETLDAKLNELITEKVHNCIDNILSDLFRSYGSLSKQLEEQLKDALKIDLSKVKIETYNERVMIAVKSGIDKVLDERAAEMILDRVNNEVAYSMRDEIKMSELVNEFAKSFDWEREDMIEPTIIIDESNYGSVYIALDQKSRTGRYNCEYNIAIDKKDGKVWHYEIRGIMGSKKGVPVQGDFDKLIFSLYANQTKLVIDDHETEFYRNNEYN